MLKELKNGWFDEGGEITTSKTSLTGIKKRSKCDLIEAGMSGDEAKSNTKCAGVTTITLGLSV